MAARGRSRGYLKDAASGVLVALYVPLLAGFAVLLLTPDDGAARVLAFIATVVASDVGGYTAGVLFGKHRMAPSISPKKSWEGMAGSVLACMLVATPFVVLALGSARALRGVGWLRTHARTVQIVGGLMLMAVGIALVTGAWDLFVSWIRDSFISEVTLPV